MRQRYLVVFLVAVFALAAGCSDDNTGGNHTQQQADIGGYADGGGGDIDMHADGGADTLGDADAGMHPDSGGQADTGTADTGAADTGTADTGTADTTSTDTPPTISSIADQTIDEDTSTRALSFSVADDQTDAVDLVVTAASSDTTLIPDSYITLGGTGADRTIEVTPATDQNGTATITLTVDDGENTTQQQFDVTVTPVADAPTITTVSAQTIDEDASTGALPFTVADVDTPAASLMVTSASTNPILFPSTNVVLTGTGADRTVEVTPAADQNGSAIITLTVSDGTSSAQTQFVVSVSPVNDPPTVSTVANQTIDEDTATGALAFTIGDVDNAVTALTVTASSSDPTLVPNANITLGGSSANRTVDIAPAANQNGTATITLAVSDGTTTAQSQFDVTVSPVNDPPTISTVANQTIDEDTSTGALAFTIGDVDTGDTLTVNASSSDTTLVPNANISLGGSGANRTVSVTPAANQNGSATITLTVSDGTTTAQSQFDVTVSPVNDPPTISSVADLTIDEDTSSGPVSFTVGDPDAGDTLIVTASSSNTTLVPNSNFIVSVNVGTSRFVRISPAANQYGTTTVTLTVSDGTATAQTHFVLTVTPVNDPPTISTVADQTIDEDTSTGALSFTVGDVDNAATTLVVTASSTNTTLVPTAAITMGGSGTDRTVDIAPAANQYGTASITLTVSDGAATAQTQFNLTVTPVNDPPTISSVANQIISEDTSTGALSFTVGDADPSDTLTVTAASSDTTLIPDANIALGGSGANRTVSLMPAANHNGAATITLTVSDGTLTAQTQFDVSVTAVNDPPTISTVASQHILLGESTGALSFTVGDVDTPLNNVSVSASSLNTTVIPNGNITLGGSGANRTIDIAAGAVFGAATIEIAATDGSTVTTMDFVVDVLPQAHVAAGIDQSCIITTSGALACWGHDLYGQASPPSGTGFVQVSAGFSFTCAVKTDGSLACWGTGNYGSASPPAGTDFVQVSAGYYHACALKTDGSIVCWGSDTQGQASPPSGTDFVQVSAGYYHTCALKTDGSLACWGDDSYGKATPPSGTDFAQISAGDHHTCALKTGGSIVCWGSGGNGETSAPSGTDFAEVSAGGYHTCALRTDGSLACWGYDADGESSPPSGIGFAQVDAGQFHTCALRTDATVACWGKDTYGQVSGAP